jgi:hypothetical protein
VGGARDDIAVVATALMLFCNDGRLHLLYAMPDYAEFFNVLDHFWRANVNSNAMGVMTMAAPVMSVAPPACE